MAIGSVTQCVEELVLNAIDACALCIAVRLDLPGGVVQVVDNGCGLTQDELGRVASRYMTSKCHTVADLDNLNQFGFRGEALASIRDMCLSLHIETRTIQKADTFIRSFQVFG